MTTSGKTSKRRRYLQGLKMAASGNAQAFGFSILITVSYGIASQPGASPSTGEQLAFAFSAVAAFSLLNLLVAALGGKEPDSVGSEQVMLVAMATDFVAVGAGLGAAFGIQFALDGLAAWILIPFTAGVAYMLVQAVELALARADAEKA